MIELQDITLREYFEIDSKEEYDFAIKYTKSLYNEPLDIFNIGDITVQSFRLVKDLQYDIEQGITWMKLLDYLEILTNKKSKELANHKLIAICRMKSYLVQEIERVNMIESELLSYVANSEEQNAGIEDFNKFGTYGQKRKLAITFNTTPYEIEKWKYSDCLLELYYQKVEHDFQDKLFKIKSRRH